MVIEISLINSNKSLNHIEISYAKGLRGLIYYSYKGINKAIFIFVSFSESQKVSYSILSKLIISCGLFNNNLHHFSVSADFILIWMKDEKKK